LCAALFTVCISFAQDTPPEGSVVAKLDAAITSSGALKGTLLITTSGPLSLPFRAAFLQNPSKSSATLLGRFTKDRGAGATPVVIDDGSQDRPLKIQFQINEEGFILPIQRQLALPLDLLTLVPPLTNQPDGNLRLGSPGSFREEISLDIPAGFALDAALLLNGENAFASYRADAKFADGKLIVVREFVLKQETIAGSKRSEVESFWKTVSDDQQRPYILRRTKRVDLTEWIRSVPAGKTKLYGAQAYQQREYDASRLLLERATRTNPNDPVAWNELGRALAALGRLEEAQMAYEKQIAINPRDAFNVQ
jgi:tetratricopeptide (TPR) repeat protein